MDVYVHMCAGVHVRGEHQVTSFITPHTPTFLKQGPSLNLKLKVLLNLLACECLASGYLCPLPQALGLWNTTPYLAEARPLTWLLHGGWGFKLRFTYPQPQI